jgi:hypothetical protein
VFYCGKFFAKFFNVVSLNKMQKNLNLYHIDTGKILKKFFVLSERIFNVGQNFKMIDSELNV